MDFRVLGPFEVWEAQRLVDVPAPKQRAILAYWFSVPAGWFPPECGKYPVDRCSARLDHEEEHSESE